MKRAALGLAMGVALSMASAQQVWRCEQDGQVRYTDQPCEKNGRPLPPRQLKVNIADGLASEAARAAAPASAASDAVETVEAAAPPASAPSAVDEGAVADAARVQPPAVASRRSYRRHVMRVAMQGLMDTDFVQRGYVPRRQNPTSTPNP